MLIYASVVPPAPVTLVTSVTAVAEALVVDDTAPYYRNEWYGFFLSWPPGVDTAVAAENGDGILAQESMVTVRLLVALAGQVGRDLRL